MLEYSGEDSPLLAPTVKARNARLAMKSAKSGVTYNRFGMLVILTIMAVFALYSENQISQLELKLEDSAAKVQSLEESTTRNEQVIERFNSSITNTDVITRLQLLEQNLSSTVSALDEQLAQTRREIQSQLDSTVNELNQSVAAAELEISEQVDKVKKDVEHYVITTQDQFSMENSFMVYQLAGTFTLLSCLISMWHMTAHLRRLNQPDVQRKILAILWMCPIYAVTSWFSLVFPHAEGYLAIVKDGYEAYVIYQFLSFCISVLGKGDRGTVVDLLTKHVDHLTPPFRLFGCFHICGFCVPKPYESDRHLADAILLQCQFFAMQFVFFRPLTTTAMVVLGKLHYYGGAEGPNDYRAPQPYITIIQNVSIFVAFTGLLKFYHAVDKELAWCRPFAKFLTIKGVVFMTFWQGLAISVLAETTEIGGVDADEWAKSAQNFLICLEMLLFSIAHFYCFPTDEWEDGYRVKHTSGKFGDSIALGDFFTDLKLLLKAKSKKKPRTPKQASIPEGDDESDDEDAVDASTDAWSGDDEERAVALALDESLGGLSDDPDIADAKRRLIESKVLSPTFFEGNDSFDFDESDVAMFEKKAYANSETDSHERSENSIEDDDDAADDAGESDHYNESFDYEHPVDGEHDLGPRNDAPSSAEMLNKATPSKRRNNAGSSTEEDEANGSEQEAPPSTRSINTEGSSFAEALRPSIFTTVASIAALEGENAKDGD